MAVDNFGWLAVVLDRMKYCCHRNAFAQVHYFFWCGRFSGTHAFKYATFAEYNGNAHVNKHNKPLKNVNQLVILVNGFIKI